MPFLPDREAMPPSVTSMKEFQRQRFGSQMENRPISFSGVSASNSGISGYILRNEQNFDSRQQMYNDRPVQYRHDPFTIDQQYEDNFVPIRIPTPGPYYAQSQAPTAQWNGPRQQLPPPQYQSQPYHLEMPAPEAYQYVAPIRQNSLLDDTIGPFWGPTNGFAPMLHPAAIHIPGTSNSSSPPNFMNYASYGPSDRLSCLTYTDPTTFTKEDITHAFAVWYVKQVTGVLVYPGSFRAGTGGSSEEEWGPGGRARDGWLRIGRQPPDYSSSWGRMGMTATPIQPHRHHKVRNPDNEPHDPWRIVWNSSGRPSSSLILFVQDLLQRMSISPTSVVTAAYFLRRLGLHEGDGEKGEKLRRFLRQSNFAGPEPIEKRVAMLGLILAGKWLDDNSFLTKSWTEVTYISIDEIDIMERYALQDLYHSLFIPSNIWGEHVQTLLNSLLGTVNPDHESYIVCVFLDAMLSETREQETEIPVRPLPNFERRLSAEELPAAADQALSKDWGDFVRPYVNNMPLSQVQVPSQGSTVRLSSFDVDAQMGDFYYQPSAVEDEEMDDVEEDEYLEYDGAQRWLPSIAELRRSGSGSSGTGVEVHRNLPQPPPLNSTWSSGQPMQSRDAPLRHQVGNLEPPVNSRFPSSMESNNSIYSLNSTSAAIDSNSPTYDPAIVEIGQDAYFDPAISMIVPQDSPLSQRGESRVWRPIQHDSFPHYDYDSHVQPFIYSHPVLVSDYR